MADENWKTLPLGECLTLQRGFDLSAAERKPGAVPVVSSSGITGYHATAPVKGPGVVTGRYGTIGEVFYVEQDFWPLNTTLWVKDFKGNNPKFASFLLRTIDFRSCSDKSSVPGVNRNDLHRILVDLPPPGQQRAIADVLSAFDDKVELNRRMNQTLESMARAIFRSWFVDFAPVVAKAEGRQPFGMSAEVAGLFPSQFRESELGVIPKGWTVESIGDRASKIQYGYTQSASKLPVGPKFLRITDIQGGRVDWGAVPYCECSEKDFETYRICAGDILVARTGASTGENIYIADAPVAVFASYLVRVQFANRGVARVVGQFMRSEEYFNYIEGSWRICATQRRCPGSHWRTTRVSSGGYRRGFPEAR